MPRDLLPVLIAAVLAFSTSAPSQAQGVSFPLRYAFGSKAAPKGFTQALLGEVYSPERGYGFEPGSKVTAIDRSGRRGGFVTGDGPFLFSVKLPPGNYTIRLTLGDAAGPSATTVKAEARRLILEDMETKAGEFATPVFTVNVRTPDISGGGRVKLKPREIGPPLNRDWDEKLTLEFNGAHPCLDSLEISPAGSNVPTLYIAGDSTVTDQPDEPWSAWGQMLPRFFGPGVAVANNAESGETLRSFLDAGRLDEILGTMKAGDYLFIQFGHNDQKERGEGIGAFTSYAAELKQFIAETRKRGGIPVLVTPMYRRRFDDAGHLVETLGDYPEAIRRTAREENVALIDLHAMSKTLFEALGSDGTLKAFVHYPAGTFPGQDKALKDDTHFNSYGAYELAKCVVEGIKANKLGIAKDLTGDAQQGRGNPTGHTPPFDPAHPDPADQWHLPASPSSSATKPYGS